MTPADQTPVRVKICCIASVAEARMAVAHGASAIGLVSAMPSGPGPIDETRIAEIAATVPPGISTFLLTSLRDPDEIIAQHARCGTSTIQLVDRPTPGSLQKLRAALPGIRLVQVVHVTGPESIDEALDVATDAHALLLDSGRPAGAVPELGGTGRVHDWTVSAGIVARSPVPVFLAGGLNPDNAPDALEAVHPFGLDLCSGVRTEGRLDESKLARFFGSLRPHPLRL